MNRLWMLCYDIADDRNRHEMAEALLGVGERVQESVFECSLTQEALRRLLNTLVPLLDPASDSLRAYPMCAWCEERVTWHGLGRRADDPDLWII
jgi:CRISPR-associated protein Cas2